MRKLTDKYFHILFEEQGIDLTLKNAWIRVEQVSTDDYKLKEYEFFLENIDHLNFIEKTMFRLYNDMLDIDYLCEVVKSYDSNDNFLALKIIEWQE